MPSGLGGSDHQGSFINNNSILESFLRKKSVFHRKSLFSQGLHSEGKMSFNSGHRDLVNKSGSSYSRPQENKNRMTVLPEEDLVSISTIMGRLSLSNKSMMDECAIS
jgi:hypothetical protein